MAERYGDELAEALPGGRPGRRLRRAGGAEAQPDPGQLRPAAIARPAQPGPSAQRTTVGLRQDRRRVRPQLRVLRHPELPWAAAQPHRRADPRRGRPARRPGDRARRPGPRRRTGATSPTAAGGAVNRSSTSCAPCSARAAWTRLLYLYPSDLTDELIDVILRDGCPVLRPLPAARQQAAAAADAPLGRRRPLPPAHRRHPRTGAGRRVPQQLHRRLPGRDRDRPRPTARLRRRGGARLVRLLRLQRRGRHAGGDARRPGRAGADARATRRAARAAGRDHRSPPRRADRHDDARAGRRAGCGPERPRGAGDRRRDRGSARSRGRLVRRRAHRRRHGSGPRCHTPVLVAGSA